MKKWALISILALGSLPAFAAQPRFPNPITPDQVWQNDRDIYDLVWPLSSNISVNKATNLVGIGTTTPQGNLHVFGNSAGAVQVLIQNVGTSATSNAALSLEPAASGGDAVIAFYKGNVSGTNVWTLGDDVSDSETIKLCRNNFLGATNNYWKVDTIGNISEPFQPSFLVTYTGTSVDQTGDGTNFTVPYAAEIFDQGQNFNTGSSVFTAPVDGRYSFCAGANIENILVSHTSQRIDLVTSNRTYTNFQQQSLAHTEMYMERCTTADMDANDTASVTVGASGGTKTVDVGGNSAALNTFSGFLAQ